jgi:glycosyltransferase involved in cell wall biosynthesis
MSCGCVVVASDTEPVREVIKDGHNGFLTDLYDPVQIAESLQRALELEDSIRQGISENARNTIVNHFGLPVVLPGQLNLMQSVVSASKR